MPAVDPIPELKREASARIVALIEGWNAEDIGYMMGIDQPRISDLRRGRLERFSLEKLIRLLSRLHQDVSLETRSRPRSARVQAQGSRESDGEGKPMGG